MRKKLKTSSRKPENVIRFGASQVGKIYGRAAKEDMNSLEYLTRTTRCSRPQQRAGYSRLGAGQHCPGASNTVGLREALGCDAVSSGQPPAGRLCPL